MPTAQGTVCSPVGGLKEAGGLQHWRRLGRNVPIPYALSRDEHEQLCFDHDEGVIDP
jgi:hypothetical protein